MKIPEIKRLSGEHSLDELQLAEAELLDEKVPGIEINGDDEGEKLTNVMGAIFVKSYMEEHGSDVMTAIRQFTLKVRKSID